MREGESRLRRLDRISQPLRSICSFVFVDWWQSAFYLIAISTFDEPDVPIYDEVSSAHPALITFITPNNKILNKHTQ
jgi:hypothetical protein